MSSLDFQAQSTPATAPPHGDVAQYDAIVIGAGFSGLYMLYRLRQLGLRARVYEAAAGVGGVWHWNRYPGARCDSPSIFYSYSFSPELQQEWNWSETFAAQPEILRYLNHVADRFDLRRDIQLETRVTAAHYDDATRRWQITTDRGDRVTTRYLITGLGCQSAANLPQLPGMDEFQGRIYHTAQWPQDGVDFTGLRVGVIGTGSSGIQAIPFIAEQAAHLTVFQRTPTYVLPSRNGPMPPEEMARVKARYPGLRQCGLETNDGICVENAETQLSVLDVSPEERQRRLEETWQAGSYAFTRAFADIFTNLEANRLVADFVRAKIAEIVHDPAVAAMLTPQDHPLGSKRIPIDTNYYPTFNRPNVTLVDIRRTPIAALTPTGLRTTAAHHDLDALVFATGFDAVTGSLTRIDIRGRGGVALKDYWAAGARTYLGLQVAGFPNLFTITGPGSPSVLSNFPTSIEQHVDWIAACLTHLTAHGYTTIEATPAAEVAWGEQINTAVRDTLLLHADSWYLGANIPGKPRHFLAYAGGIARYRRHLEAVVAADYQGFVVDAPAP